MARDVTIVYTRDSGFDDDVVKDVVSVHFNETTTVLVTEDKRKSKAVHNDVLFCVDVTY